MRERNAEIDIRKAYESKLVTLNKSLEDINEKLQVTNKQLQDALQEKENFILRFSHEIRNPLNSLLGNVELCHEYAQESDYKIMLKEAKISGEILLQLLNNVLDTAKVASGRLDISVHAQNIREFLERAWVVTSEIIRKKGLFGCLSVNIDVPEMLDFDNHRLMQILINTISNATKFTDSGYVKVFVDFEEGSEIKQEHMQPRHLDTFEKAGEDEEGENLMEVLNEEELSENPKRKYEHVTVTKKKFIVGRFFTQPESLKTVSEYRTSMSPLIPKKGNLRKKARHSPITKATSNYQFRPREGFIRLEITDSGCGIKKKDLETLFDKFSQVSKEPSKRQIGTGLGLWITKEIIELMEGKVEVFSVPKHGTTLVIMLKSRSSLNPQSSNKTEQPIQNFGIKSRSDCISAEEYFKIRRVLVVEDIPYNQEVNRRFLTKCEGIEAVIIANNGKEALDLFLGKGEGFFDLILMDIDMPVMDGKTAAKMIRQHEDKSGWRPTAMVFLTAYSESKIQKELLDKDGIYRANGFLSKPASYEIIKRTITEQTNRVRKQISSQLKNRVENTITEVSRTRNNTILLVDDDSFNLAMMSRMIIACGFKSIQARNGAEAIQLYHEHRNDITYILMDCEMPVMNGWEATKTILQLYEKSDEINKNKLAIYGLTGHVGGEYKQKCVEVGMKDVLEKPITIDRLKNLLWKGLVLN